MIKARLIRQNESLPNDETGCKQTQNTFRAVFLLMKRIISATQIPYSWGRLRLDEVAKGPQLSGSCASVVQRIHKCNSHLLHFSLTTLLSVQSLWKTISVWKTSRTINNLVAAPYSDTTTCEAKLVDRSVWWSIFKPYWTSVATRKGSYSVPGNG